VSEQVSEYDPWIVVVDEDCPAGFSQLVSPWLEDGTVVSLFVAVKQPGRNTWSPPYECQRAP